MRVTTPTLMRAAAACAVLSGLLFIVIQFIHPEESLAAVATDSWAIVGLMTLLMALLGLIGVAGIYLRQAEPAGLLGLLGFASLAVFFLLTIAFTFAEALILPLIVDQAPGFVENFNGIFNGQGTDGTLGTLESIGLLAGGLYLIGGVLLGIALARARILWRWAAILLAVGAVAAPLTALVPHEVGRFAALPVGVALIGLGVSLWSDMAIASSSQPFEIPKTPTTQPAV